jgi:hypothetical protein
MCAVILAHFRVGTSWRLVGIRNSRIVTVQFVFFETLLFTRLLPGYLDDDAYRHLQRSLLQRPDRGSVMPGAGGFRKLRWEDPRRGKGKRGGLRVIYCVFAAESQIWLFTIYDKGETENLTAEQCRRLRNAILAERRARRSGA